MKHNARKNKTKARKASMKNTNIANTTKVFQTVGETLIQAELGRIETANGFKFRVIKYDDAENVVLFNPMSGSVMNNKCMLGAIEVIIPEKFNNTNMVKNLEERLSTAFVNLQDAKWFKADKDTSFEKVGDNVLELYGHMTYQAANEIISAMESFN